MIEILVALIVFHVVKSLVPNRMWWVRKLNSIGHHGAAYEVCVTELRPGDRIHVANVTVQRIEMEGDHTHVTTTGSRPTYPSNSMTYYGSQTVLVDKAKPAWYSGVCHRLADTIWALDRRAKT